MMASLTLLAQFDDLVRCQEVLTGEASEIAFQQFLDVFYEQRANLIDTNNKNSRLQMELDQAIVQISSLEAKFNNARRLLDVEKRCRERAENERDQMEKKMHVVRDLLRNEKEIRDETRDKLAFLNSPRKRRSGLVNEKIHEEDTTTSEHMDSTGSLLSEMSMTKSENDFLDCRPSKKWRKNAMPMETSVHNTSNKRKRLSTERGKRSATMNVFDLGSKMHEIVAQTTLSMHKSGEGPVIAESVIEAKPIPPPPQVKTKETPAKKSKERVRSRSPSAPPMEEEVIYATVKKPPRTPIITSITAKAHQFVTKTMFVQSDNCTFCGKRIRFSSNYLKCCDCRATLHMQCSEKYAQGCFPAASSTTPTPAKGQPAGTISDFAPNFSPMVPALIVHCVNEIEARGLEEKGIYRISASEREVKQLKERFLRGKSIPQLNNLDIHVLSGCIKDFLRSLQETLIPTALWADFSNAAQSISAQLQQQQLCDAVLRLPQPNRDTLSFLIQHFQRIANCPQVQMPLNNIAKVFAPTIVGYSKQILQEHAMYAETVVQVAVMDGLLKINADFWRQFANIERGAPIQSSTDDERVKYGFQTTPSASRVTKSARKFYGTPPYSTIKKK